MILIAVDGLDGCGKDSHALRIAGALSAAGKEVTVMSHPSRRIWGRLSKKSLQSSGPVARLFATVFYTIDVLISVRWFNRQSRSSDSVIIFVRYLLGTAYLPETLAPLGYSFFRKFLPFPDLAIFIDIDPEVAIRRIRKRGSAHEMFETRAKHERIRKVARRLTAKDWVVVDNSQDGEGPFRVTEEIVVDRFIRVSSSPS